MVQASESTPYPANSAQTSEASGKPWAHLLENLLRCPTCGGAALKLAPDPVCSACGWLGLCREGIVDYVEEGHLDESHRAEMEAQGNAVETYYENERKLACHWDRISADQLPAALDWPGGTLLDMGCGTGSAGGGLRRSGAKVVGVDLSLSCLQVAQRRLDAVVRADAVRLPFRDAAFDGLVARGALHHLADADAALAEASRVLRPGAPALFLDPREFSWLEPIKDKLRLSDDSFTDDHHAYTAREYRELIGRHFEIEQDYSEHPLGVLLVNGLDLLPLPAAVPSRLIAAAAFRLDALLNRTPLRRAGFLLVVRARRR